MRLRDIGDHVVPHAVKACTAFRQMCDAATPTVVETHLLIRDLRLKGLRMQGPLGRYWHFKADVPKEKEE